MSGDADWGIVVAADKRIMGVYSKAKGVAAVRLVPSTVTRGDTGYAHWQFVYRPGSQPTAASAPVRSSAPDAPLFTSAAAGSPAPSIESASSAPTPAPKPSPTTASSNEKPSDCIALRAADNATCAALAKDPKAYEICRRSSNRRYGACTIGGSIPSLVTQ
jgi:hypothetical protein